MLYPRLCESKHLQSLPEKPLLVFFLPFPCQHPVLRNRNLANVFYRLGFVEIFGTGITRIKHLYEEGLIKPDFEVSENTIKIVLPVFEKNLNLTENEQTVYKFLSKTMLKPISEIAPYVPFGRSKTTQLLKGMEQKGIVVVEGKGRGTKYILK